MPDEVTPKDPSEKQDGADQRDAPASPAHPEATTLKEPGDTLPQITLQDLPEKLQRAVANGGLDLAHAGPGPLHALHARAPRSDGAVPHGERQDGRVPAAHPRADGPLEGRLPGPRPRAHARTRQQVAKEAELLAASEGLRTALLYGGAAYGPQLDALKGGAHLVVGTPGRVLDHLLKGTLSLRHLQILVFDEADRMLSMGFYPDMRRVKSYLPDRPINGYMFSATFPPFVVRLAGRVPAKARDAEPEPGPRARGRGGARLLQPCRP